MAPVNPYREAGLPYLSGDVGGEHSRTTTEIGVVRASYPDRWEVDIEAQMGGLIRKAQVVGDVLPEVHQDGDQPSYVEYWHRGGHLQDVQCRPYHWRRMKGPESAGEPEKRLYHKHLQIQRVGDITIRITPDHRIYLYDAESGDYCLYDQGARTFHVIGPHIFLGTDDQTRIEYHKDDEVRVVIPKCLIGQTAVQDEDGVSYLAGQLIHLVSDLVVKATAGTEIDLIAPLIKLTASSIVLDPVNIKLGHANATERVPLGDLLIAAMNTFRLLFNGHTHTGVQSGSNTSGPPSTPTTFLDDSVLSDVAHVSKTGT